MLSHTRPPTVVSDEDDDEEGALSLPPDDESACIAAATNMESVYPATTCRGAVDAVESSTKWLSSSSASSSSSSSARRLICCTSTPPIVMLVHWISSSSNSAVDGFARFPLFPRCAGCDDFLRFTGTTGTRGTSTCACVPMLSPSFRCTSNRAKSRTSAVPSSERHISEWMICDELWEAVAAAAGAAAEVDDDEEVDDFAALFRLEEGAGARTGAFTTPSSSSAERSRARIVISCRRAEHLVVIVWTELRCPNFPAEGTAVPMPCVTSSFPFVSGSRP